ncbi:unnamed protein product, partial [Iphiclides podalirius]
MRKNGERIYPCIYIGCDSKFNRPYRLEQHLLSHLNIKPFPCPWEKCQKGYSNKSHLNRHISSAHENVSTNIVYRCSQCLKRYSNRQNLKKHIKLKHVINNTFVCDICNVQCKKKHQLNSHMYLHNGVKAFSCEICTKEFVSLHEKKRHMRGHKTYTCEHCSITFNHWSKYQRHKKSEHDVKEYICNECGKKYKQRSYIIRHLKTHFGGQLVRKFSCPYSNCYRRYSRNSNLTQHIFTKHKNIKHLCNICHIGLSSKAKLNEHLKHHTEGNHMKKEHKSLPTGRKERKDKDSMKISTALKLAGIKKLEEKSNASCDE